MNLFKQKLLLAFIGLAVTAVSFGQPSKIFSRSSIIERLKKDVYALVSDSLEGREAGTIGERQAAYFLAKRMEEIGLEPLFDGSFFQEFQFMGRVMLGENNTLSIGTKTFAVDIDYKILGQSGLGTAIGTGVYVGHGIDNEFGHNNYHGIGELDGKIFFMEYFSPPGYDESKEMRSWESLLHRINTAIEKGAKGIVLVNTNESITNPRITLRSRRGALNIPIVFANSSVFEAFKLVEYPTQITISVDLHQHELTSLNVGGYLNNNAATTVVIGGHFDHLGFGGESSRAPGEALIHPGADDNASGTAGLLEAALFLKESNLKQNNYIFLAIGAEEIGLIGSRFFVDSEAYDIDRINYMFNLDMIGRVTENRLDLIGTGSSPTWNNLIDAVDHGSLEVRKVSGALGGSDHSSFYAKGIPVLFFFSGIHEDYHRPTDTPDKINFEGMVETMNLVYRIIEKSEGEAKLAHSPSGSPTTQRRRTEGVSLGVMPDHAHTGIGLKVLAVIEGRPAKNAGVENGDLIIKLNNTSIEDIQIYMQVLGELRPGTTVPLKVQRGEETINLEVKL